MDYIKSIDIDYYRIAFFIITSVIILFLSKRILNSYYDKLIEERKWYFTKKIVDVFVRIIIVVLLFLTFGNRLGSFSTTIGLTGAGITFALREVIVSIAGWFAIIFGDFFKVGDRVLLGGIKGDVIDLGILRTTLMEIGEWVEGDQYTGRIVRVANSFIFTSPVYNYSANFEFVWDEIKVPIRFGSNYSLARKIIDDVALEIVGDYPDNAKQSWKKMRRKFKLEDAKLCPQTFLTFNDNWIQISLRYVVDFSNRRGTKDRIYERLLEEFENNREEIQLASETIEIVRANIYEDKDR